MAEERTASEEEDGVEIVCKATGCFRNLEGKCLLADVVKGEGKITLDEGGRCQDFFIPGTPL